MRGLAIDVTEVRCCFSNNGVDKIRDIIDDVKWTPTTRSEI